MLEEGRHATILAEMLRTLGSPLLTRSWSATLFRHARGVMGVRVKLLVLLAAQIVGIGFYSFVKDRLPSGSFRAALHEIIQDEFHHLAFHSDFFRLIFPKMGQRTIFCAVWAAATGLACAVVLYDHAVTLRLFRVPIFKSVRRLVSLILETQRRILLPPGEVTKPQSVVFAF